MANLSAYLNFSVALRYDLASKKIYLTDTSSYPAGVSSGITGIVTVTQPDGVTRTGSFASPDVTYDYGALTQGIIELRVGTDGLPQNGAYTVTYTVRHSGYDDTTLTRVFLLNYSDPLVVITKSFNVFSPVIKAVDTTSYDVTGLSLQGLTRAWTATIGSVGTKVGSDQEFDMSIGGSYYDADYAIGLTSTVNWTLSNYSWVSLYKKVTASATGSADTPKTLAQLRALLDAYKLELDALINNDFQYDTKNAYYTKASLLFQQMVDRGRYGEYAGLEDYYWEIVRQLNDGVAPSYSNTNAVIPAYDWGTNVGSASWSTITNKPSSIRIQWVTGDGSYPAAGTSTFTDSRMSDVKIIYFRNGIVQFKGNPGDGDSYYEKPDTGAGSNVLTVYGAFQTGDKNVIYTWPL